MNKPQHPPQLPLRFFRWFCHPDYLEDIEGDLLERFYKNVEQKGSTVAKLQFVLDVFRLFRPGIVAALEGTQKLNYYGMFKNYFKATYRNLLANKAFGFVNVLGLLIAFTSAIIILLHIDFESSYDSFHEQKDRLYRVDMETIRNGELESTQASTFSALGPSVMAEIPGVETYTRVFQLENAFFTIPATETGDTISFRLPSVAYVEEAFLSMFTFGNISPKALEQPNSIVLTECAARKFFANENPIGRTIFLHGKGDNRSTDQLVVTGVIEDVPGNSHLQFEVLVPYASQFSKAGFLKHSWNFDRAYTYLLLEPKADPGAVETQMPALVEKYNGDKMAAQNVTYQFALRPVEDIHLTSDVMYEVRSNGSLQAIYFLATTAFLILTISWLNSVNLAHVRNSMRTKEIQIRKVLGAHKFQVFVQLFFESFFINIVALSLAIVLVMTAGTSIENYLNITLRYATLSKPFVLGIILMIIIVGSLISSLDVSFVKSVFRGGYTSRIVARKGGGSIRNSSIVFQFAISPVIIIVTLTVRSQLNFINSFDLGIEKEYSIVIDATGRPGDQAALHQSSRLFKTTMRQQSWLKSISASNQVPGEEPTHMGGFREEGHDLSEGKEMTVFLADEDFVSTLGLRLKAGRGFRYQPRDTIDLYCEVIINNKAVETLGFGSAEKAVQKTLVDHRNQRRYHVVGVIEDYHQESLRKDVEPLVIWNHKYAGNYFILSLAKGNISEQLSAIEKSWNSIYPNTPFDFVFLDDHIDRLYQSEREFGRLFTIFSAIGVLIACMGIFSLSSSYAAQRIREVGIRKVLGAGFWELVWLLSYQFLLLTVVGLIIGLPVATYVTTIWLENFAYRMPGNWWLYAVSGLAVLTIGWLTVCLQTAKAANVNPVECLRNE